MKAASAMAALDFTLRLAVFVAAPVLLYAAGLFYPLTGTVLGFAFVLGLFLALEVLRPRVERSPLLRRVLRRPLAMEAYYREHPPRPFAYYLFYPLLFPYWLVVPQARRELLLFRGFGLATVVVLAGHAAWDYLAHWAPELPFDYYAGIALELFLIQVLCTLTFLVPLGTTLVQYRIAGRRRRLRALLGTALGVVAVLAGLTLASPRSLVPAVVRVRLHARTIVAPREAARAMIQGLAAVEPALRARPSDWTPSTGEVVGESRARGVEALSAFYREDEARTFRFWLVRAGAHSVFMTVAPSAVEQPIWLAVDERARRVEDLSALPAQLRRYIVEQTRFE